MVMLMEKVEKLNCSILWAWLGVRGMSWSMLLTPTTTRHCSWDSNTVYIVQ